MRKVILIIALTVAGSIAFCEESPDEKAIQALIKQLESPEFTVREKATEALIKAGEFAAPALDRASKTFDAEVLDRIVRIRDGMELAKDDSERQGWTEKLKAIQKGWTLGQVHELLKKLGVDPKDSHGRSIHLDTTWNLRIITENLKDHEKNAPDKGTEAWRSRRVVWNWRVIGFPDLKPKIKHGLYPLVLAIHRSHAGNEDSWFSPVNLIRAVNLLHASGEKTAYRALEAYDILCLEADDPLFIMENPRFGQDYELERDRLVFILRILFVRADGAADMPRMYIDPNDIRGTFPLWIEDDIPFLAGDQFAGNPGDGVSEHLAFCWKHCVLRKAPLCPRGDPLAAVRKIWQAKTWKLLSDKNEKGVADEDTGMLERMRVKTALQAHRCVADTLKERTQDYIYKDFEAWVEKFDKQLLSAKPQWSPENQRYERKP